MSAFDDAPGALIAVGFAASALGVVLLLLLCWHVVRRILDEPRVPLGAGTYAFLLFICIGACALGAAALGTAFMFRDYERIENPTRLAQLKCIRGGPDRVQLTVTPLATDRRNEERFELQGSSCAMSVDVVHLRPALRRLGVEAFWRVAKVGSQERPRRNPPWLTPGPGSPFGIVVQDAIEQSVAAEPDERGSYFLVASPSGVAVEKAHASAGKAGT